jgi:choline dehydrogenase-like flavoprotein
VRARAVGGRTLVWGRVALRLSDFDFKAASHDGHGDDWPISYVDLKPYYDNVDRLIGVMGAKEGLPQLPDGIFQKPRSTRRPDYWLLPMTLET